MALFNSPSPRRQFNNRQQQRTDDLPKQLEKLRQAVCHNHFGPVPMKFIGKGSSSKGLVMAIYACPVCNARQGWIQDYRTGRPHRLFTKAGN